MDVTVYIRTHDSRLYLANDLKAMCERAFPQDVRVLLCNTGAPSPHYNEMFILELSDLVPADCSEYTLLLEDDIILSPSSHKALSVAIERGDDHNWYTVDTTSDILSKSVCVPGYGYILSSANHISYSGAILVRTKDLLTFLEEYILHRTEFEHPNFDITFSAFLLRTHGHLHLRPGHFLQRPAVVSSITFDKEGRVSYSPFETFEYTGPEV